MAFFPRARCHYPASMSPKRSIQISARVRAAQASPEQERFSFLLAEIEKVRRSHAKMEKVFLEFRREHSSKLAPLREKLRNVCRESVFSIDRLLDQPGWSRADRVAL